MMSSKSNHVSSLLAALSIASILLTGAFAESVTLKVADAQAATGKEVEVPVLIEGSTKSGPMQFIVTYDPAVLEAVKDAPGAEPRGVTFAKGLSGTIAHEPGFPGESKIALLPGEAITEDGELIRVRFKVLGEEGTSSAIGISSAEVWEKDSLIEVLVSTVPGTFSVSSSGIPLPLILAIAAGGVFLILLIALLARKKSTAAAGAHTPQQPAYIAGAQAAAPQVSSPPAAEAAVAQTPPVAAPIATPAAQPAPEASNPAEEAMAAIAKLKEMHEAGLISEEDFEKKKQDLLDRI